jgi:hypothetical protein
MLGAGRWNQSQARVSPGRRVTLNQKVDPSSPTLSTRWYPLWVPPARVRLQKTAA